MKTRAITGFFFIIVMIGSQLLGPIVLGIFYLLLSLLCLNEFYGLNIKSGIAVNRVAGLLTGFLMFVGFGLIAMQVEKPVQYSFIFILTLATSLIFISELFKISVAPLTNIAYTFLGLIFVVSPFLFFFGLAFIGNTYTPHLTLGFLVMLWSNDTGAYLTGRAFGRTKLFERHSPKKTVEGFFGGIAIAAIAGYILSIYYKDLKWEHWVITAVLIGSFGTLGDLVESMFKRSINIKDSGSILPGHGGLLDRFDGLLLAAPIVYTYLYFILNT
ncbi:phosphatidate cytidylyltransferase [Mucilaginibacter pallidiroseus]|uniref:Phosphatidate cytidylyltransferase n=1 Tax=Mucilaginibacter pallidiroseus TaxID=2599295 RepID=A0A563UEL4_9SPHI|nr:phosphatidate cytidylyltransferase [Mucilaginibacter pallidiroseus]TWR29812.1 phosphatidate cytidylyltransferase [Mucilaginibacter pallidiroseus]